MKWGCLAKRGSPCLGGRCLIPKFLCRWETRVLSPPPFQAAEEAALQGSETSCLCFGYVGRFPWSLHPGLGVPQNPNGSPRNRLQPLLVSCYGWLCRTCAREGRREGEKEEEWRETEWDGVGDPSVLVQGRNVFIYIYKITPFIYI